MRSVDIRLAREVSVLMKLLLMINHYDILYEEYRFLITKWEDCLLV